MKTTIVLCFSIIALFAFKFANAAIFKCVAPNGLVAYSNVMGEGCIKLKLEWEKISESSDGATVYYAPDTIRKNGDRVKMWYLYDYKNAQDPFSEPYLSKKAQFEDDCKEEQIRLLAFSVHSGNMGAGEVVYSNSDPLKWEPVWPSSIGETMWKFACGIK